MADTLRVRLDRQKPFLGIHATVILVRDQECNLPYYVERGMASLVALCR